MVSDCKHQENIKNNSKNGKGNRRVRQQCLAGGFIVNFDIETCSVKWRPLRRWVASQNKRNMF